MEHPDNDCFSSWTGNYHIIPDTTWLGHNITYDYVNQKLIANPSVGWYPITFDFKTETNDSTIFYSDLDYDYYLKAEKFTSEIVLDSLDSVKTFSIWKYDKSDNLISSPLNGFEIKLGEKYGLYSFIECNKFPEKEEGYTLVGQTNPSIGSYQLTYDMLYPWNVGDKLQFEGTARDYATSDHASTYQRKLITITDRIETKDSVWIYWNEKIQLTTSLGYITPKATNITFDNPIKFKKGDLITDFPNNSTFGSITTTYETIDNCGDRKGITQHNEFLSYCPDCNCFVAIDGHGSSDYQIGYTEGLGIKWKRTNAYNPYIGLSTSSTLIWSSIGGEECGTYSTVNTEEIDLNQSKTLIKIIDITGRETSPQKNRILLYIFDNGTVEKIYNNYD